MTDVQIPLQQSHQKAGMNGKFLSTKNSLEIRGGGVTSSASNSSSDISKSLKTATQTTSLSSTTASNSNTLSSGSGSLHNSNTNTNDIAKKSLKIIEKNQANLTNFQLYPIRLNANNEKFDSIGTLVSVNYIMSNTNSNNSKIQLNDNGQISFYKNPNSNSYNINNISRSYTGNSVNVNQWNDESNSGWTGTGVMSDRSSVYSIDDGVCRIFLSKLYKNSIFLRILIN